MKCANLPDKVWYRDEVWHVVGGCACCYLRLWRQDPALATGHQKQTTHETWAKTGEWTKRLPLTSGLRCY